MENRLNDEIKDIVASGKYDLELISFEFDIPIEKLKKYQNELIEKRKNDSKQSLNDIEISDETGGLIAKFNKCKSERDKEKRARIISRLISNIKTINLSIEQCEILLSEIEQKDIIKEVKGPVLKRGIELKYLNAINDKINEITNTDALKELKKKLTDTICMNNPIIANGLRIKIDEQINKINSNKAIKQLYQSISPDILLIVSDLASGIMKSEKALELISNEAQKRMRIGPKTIFALNEEQQRKQVIMQIKGCLKKNAIQYPICNPKATIEQLQTLGDINQIDAIGIVIQNMIERSKFEDARKLCDEYCTIKDRENPMYPHISSLRTMIKSAENKQKDSSEPIK